MKHSFPIFFVLLLFTVSCKKTTSLVQKLHDEEKVEHAYYLYPSTLRMLNFVDLESVNKVVKDVEKVTFMNMDTDSFDYEQMLRLSTDLQKDESYDLYVEIEDVDNLFYILGKESPAKTMFLITNEGNQYIVDIEGSPDYLQLTRAWEDISTMDSTETTGFSMLRDLVDRDAKWEERRRVSRKKREEKKRLEAEALQSKKDSILQDSLSTIIEQTD